MSRDRIYVVVACVVVIAALIAGFIAIGSPGNARLLRIDRQRVGDLRQMSAALHQLYKKDGRLPETLPQGLAAKYYDASRGVDYGYARPDFTRDPQTKQPYSYERMDSKNYRLCATFSLPSESDATDVQSAWSHGVGQRCYTIDASQSELVTTP